MIRKRKHNYFAYLFILMGILLLFYAVTETIKQRDFVLNSDTVEGSVVEIVEFKSSNGLRYAPRVVFITNEDEKVSFVSLLNTDKPSYRNGGKVIVRYNPNDPQLAEVDSFTTIWLGVFIFWLLGLSFSATGLAYLITTLVRNSTIKELNVANRLIEAKITDVKKNSVGAKNNFPYLICAEYEEGGKLYKFVSDPIPYNPANTIRRQTIKVIVHPTNMKKYYIDVESAMEEPAAIF